MQNAKLRIQRQKENRQKSWRTCKTADEQAIDFEMSKKSAISRKMTKT
jgi:hypothetical protein